MDVSGVACSSSVRCVTPFASSLSSCCAFRSSSVQLAQLQRVASSVNKPVSVTASLSEEQSITRRDALLSVLGVGTSLTFSGQAIAANPGSLARQRKVEKPRPERKKKPEEAKEKTVEVKNDSEIASLTSSPSPLESGLPKVSAIPESVDIPASSTVSAVPSVQEVPTPPAAAEAPAPKVGTPNSDDLNIGDYFKDLF
ncbi:hypothetical protein R1sor_020779 [Riccia sorocarpa]|uniref:Uncharacterized protein n=1 Tax=Riccia sorocarpa TaxID=122646 RepID=A0ABD3GF74_9MARC